MKELEGYQSQTIRPEESASGCKMCKSGAGRSLQGRQGSGSLLFLFLLLLHRLHLHHRHRLHRHRRFHRHRRRPQLSRTGGLKIQRNDSNIISSSKRLTGEQTSPEGRFLYSNSPSLSYFLPPFLW